MLASRQVVVLGRVSLQEINASLCNVPKNDETCVCVCFLSGHAEQNDINAKVYPVQTKKSAIQLGMRINHSCHKITNTQFLFR